jgi:hypothetical protein
LLRKGIVKEDGDPMMPCSAVMYVCELNVANQFSALCDLTIRTPRCVRAIFHDHRPPPPLPPLGES